MVACRMGKEHQWAWCSHCRTAMVECRTCGNNTCNAGYGTLPDGTTCGDCESAYEKDHAEPRPRHPNEAELLKHLAKTGQPAKELELLAKAAGDQDPLDYFMGIRSQCIDPEEATKMLVDLCQDPRCTACSELHRVMYPDSPALPFVEIEMGDLDIPYPPPAPPSSAVSIDDLLED